MVDSRTASHWQQQAGVLTDALVASVPGLLGVYLHGSAALGGFGSASDLDVLVVADNDPGRDWHAVGETLLHAAGHVRPVELSIVARSAAATPAPPWPFLLHVNSGDLRIVVGGQGGDPDLIAHYAVVRSAGLRLWGPPPASVVGVVGREQLLPYLVGELEWGCAEADERYAVLNACRAVASAEDDVLLSKLAGGRWWLDRFGTTQVVDRALTAQQDGIDLGRCGAGARAFIADAITRVRAAHR